MDWSNENYVRVYCRDTEDLIAAGWEGRLVLWEMMRKADRAGVVDSENSEILAEMLRIPLEICETGLRRLLLRRCVHKVRVPSEDGHEKAALFIKNFLSAQEAKSKDKVRVQKSREQRRAEARRNSVQYQPELDFFGKSCNDLSPTLPLATQHFANDRSIENAPEPNRKSESQPSDSPNGSPGAKDSQKKAKRGRPSIPPDPRAFELSQDLAHAVAKRQPGSRPARNPQDCVQSWAKDIDKLHRLDGRSWSDIAQVMTWSQENPFWQANIQSGAKLRKQFDVLEAQMKREKARKPKRRGHAEPSGEFQGGDVDTSRE